MWARLARALIITLLAGAAAWGLHISGLALPLALGLALVVFVVVNFAPWLGVRAFDRAGHIFRAWHWRGRLGRHYSFGGVPLDIHDDGRHLWLAGADLQRVLGTQDAEDVLAARHAGRWRRNSAGAVLLRVDAVVHQLCAAPGRLDPRTVRLRLYLERTVLYPAAERRRRSETMH